MRSARRVTIEFDSNPKKFEGAVDKAKDALVKIRETGIDSGKVEIDNITIQIEKLSGGK